MGNQPDQYEVEWSKEGEPIARSTPRAEPAPEQASEPEPSSIKDLDVCPNCGASMRGSEMLVCLRCGFDLKTNRVLETATSQTPVYADDAQTEQGPALVRPGMGNLWLPGAIAAISGVLLIVAYLAGAPGLVATNELGEAGSLGLRFQTLLRFLVLVVMWTGCAIGALAFLSYLIGAKFVEEASDFKLAVVRMLAAVVAMRLPTLIDITSPTLEWLTEAGLGLVAFFLVSIVLFKLKPRDGATLAGSTLILFMLLWTSSMVIAWATV